MTEWPNASNTGVPDGVKLLPSGALAINTPGVTIEGLDIKGPVYINADNVTLKNNRITATEFYIVKVKDGVKGAVVANNDINGVGTNNEGVNGIGGSGTFINNNIYNVENGISVQGSNTLVEGNYIHDLKASGAPHYDGIQLTGWNDNVTIRHNTIINEHTQTAAIIIGNTFGPVSNIKIHDNILAGGGYTVYAKGDYSSHPMTGVSFTNNHMGKGQYGYTYFRNNDTVYTGNTNDGWDLIANLDNQAPSQPVPPPPTEPTPIEPAPAEPTPEPEAPASGDKVITGGAGDDTLRGGSGNDILTGGAGQDKLYGGLGNDTYVLENGWDTVVDDGGVDTVTSTITRNIFYSGIENITLVGNAHINSIGNAANNVMTGNSGNNVLDGAGGNDTLIGGAGNDTLIGGAGNDTLVGGTGRDILTGGTGADKFVFNSTSETGRYAAARDVITDFVRGQDKIDLSAIDANGSASGNTAFAFIAGHNAAFDGRKGVVAWHKEDRAGTANDVTVIQADTNGDRVHDFEINLTGLVNLTAGDFIL